MKKSLTQILNKPSTQVNSEYDYFSCLKCYKITFVTQSNRLSINKSPILLGISPENDILSTNPEKLNLNNPTMEEEINCIFCLKLNLKNPATCLFEGILKK